MKQKVLLHQKDLKLGGWPMSEGKAFRKGMTLFLWQLQFLIIHQSQKEAVGVLSGKYSLLMEEMST